MKNTCQICAREIKANTGVIAHHGYQRPNRGSGWQTPSCWGARHLPYEDSCDQIPACIDFVKKFVSGQKRLVKELMQNPPEELIESRAMFSPQTRTFKRPGGFDAKRNEELGSRTYNTYENEHHSRVHAHEYQIKTSNQDIKRLEKRLADWVAPVRSKVLTP